MWPLHDTRFLPSATRHRRISLSTSVVANNFPSGLNATNRGIAKVSVKTDFAKSEYAKFTLCKLISRRSACHSVIFEKSRPVKFAFNWHSKFRILPPAYPGSSGSSCCNRLNTWSNCLATLRWFPNAVNKPSTMGCKICLIWMSLM